MAARRPTRARARSGVLPLEGVDDPPTRFGIGVGRVVIQTDAGCTSSQDRGELVVLQAG